MGSNASDDGYATNLHSLSLSSVVVQAKSYSTRFTYPKISSALFLYTGTYTWPTSNWILDTGYYFYEVILTVISWCLAVEEMNDANF